MFTRRLFRFAMAPLLLAATAATTHREIVTPDQPRDPLDMHIGPVKLTSAGAMAFNAEGLLFLADTRTATIYAVDPAESSGVTFSDRKLVTDLDLKVAALMGTSRDKIRFGDMARNPKTGSLYFSVSRVADGPHQSALVRSRGNDQLELVNLENIRNSSTVLPSAPTQNAPGSGGKSDWMLAITDLTFVGNELWVAGLSNEEFGSALRRIPFPFGRPGAMTSVEIFHTSHNQWETAAPITSFVPVSLKGTPGLLAGYGCSPIATFTQADLRKGGHVRGRTVAELGGGSQPVDMIQYQSNGRQWILIANNRRTLMRLSLDAIAEAPALTTGVPEANMSAGVGYVSIASSGVMHIADAGDGIAVMARNTDTGAVEVISFSKQWL